MKWLNFLRQRRLRLSLTSTKGGLQLFGVTFKCFRQKMKNSLHANARSVERNILLPTHMLGLIWSCWQIWFCISYKTHSGSNIHGSISFMIDNMHYVIFRIYEQDSVPWCGEIQNKILEVLGNTFNIHSNSTLRPRSVVSQSVSKGE